MERSQQCNWGEGGGEGGPEKRYVALDDASNPIGLLSSNLALQHLSSTHRCYNISNVTHSALSPAIWAVGLFPARLLFFNPLLSASGKGGRGRAMKPSIIITGV